MEKDKKDNQYNEIILSILNEHVEKIEFGKDIPKELIVIRIIGLDMKCVVGKRKPIIFA